MTSAKLSVDFCKQITGYISKSYGFDSFLRNSPTPQEDHKQIQTELKITAGGNGRCQAELQIGKEHINLHGGLHGGLTATLFENVTTYALMSKSNQPAETVDMQIMYLKTAAEGDTLIIDANTVRVDQSNLAYIECEVRRKGDGALVAKGEQIKYVDFQ